MTEIKLVWAEANQGAIGRAGEMPWHLPEDLAHFKAETLGSPVVMGRRTWESLPERFRPLPGRDNLVVTGETSYVVAGAARVSTLGDALARCAEQAAPTVCIIGGGQLYRAAMPIATELVVTRIALEVADADTYAPDIGPEWQLIERSDELVSASGLHYRFERYRRAK